MLYCRTGERNFDYMSGCVSIYLSQKNKKNSSAPEGGEPYRHIFPKLILPLHTHTQTNKKK